MKERAAAPFLEGSIRSYSISADKKKLLYQASGSRIGVVATDKPARVGDGLVNVAALETWVDPRAEWAEIFREAWRTQREYFYDEKMHGAHDELVVEVPRDGAAEHLRVVGRIMSTTPGWATGLPLAADGHLSRRFSKKSMFMS